MGRNGSPQSGFGLYGQILTRLSHLLCPSSEPAPLSGEDGLLLLEGTGMAFPQAVPFVGAGEPPKNFSCL